MTGVIGYEAIKIETQSVVPQVSFVRGSAMLLFAQAITFAFAFVTSIFVARILGPEGKGAYTAITWTVLLAQQLTSFGLAQANVYHSANGTYEFGRILAMSLFISFGLGGLVALGLIGFILFMELAYFGPGNAFPAIVGIAAMPFFQAWTLVRGLLLGKGAVGRFAISMAAFAVLQLFFIGAAFIVRRGGLLELMYVYTASAFGACFVTLWLTKPWFELKCLKLDRVVLVSSLRFGIKQHVTDVSEIFGRRLVLLYVAGASGLAAAGLYSVSVTLSELIGNLPVAVGTVLFSRVASSKDVGKDDLPFRASRITLLLTAVLAIGAGILSTFLISLLYGESFAPSSEIFLLLLPGTIAFVVPKVLGGYFQGRGWLVELAVSALGFLGISSVVGYMAALVGGANGAAVATTLAYVIYAVMILAFLKIRTGTSPLATLIPVREDFTYLRLGLARVFGGVRSQLEKWA